jgi:glycosyltransferase involved in cell wall biosynthesis
VTDDIQISDLDNDTLITLEIMDPSSNPVVSIIVPARNEEACLSACLESLVAQTGIVYEIIAVDDASTDSTAEIARSFSQHHVGAALQARPAVTVISAPPLPANWTGKNNAMAAGAKVAKGKWLLFTDADTVHKPGSLARALAEAEQHAASLLSYSPEQEVRGLWEKAVMPVIFAELAATYPPQAVNDPGSPIAAANGQYLLVSREAYDSVGGHTKIANDLLEDVAMARLVKFSGRKIFFRYGGDAVRTRMYRSFAQMKEGWTKNLALLFKHPLALALLRLAEFALILANLVTAILASLSGRSTLAFQTTLLTIILAGWFWIRIRKAHFPRGSNIIALLGLPVFSYLLFNSARLSGKNRVTWKGRSYGRNTEKCDYIRQNHASKSNESTLDIAATAHRRTSSEARLALSDPQS